jgi:Flp pilus assembly protein TadD
MKLSYLLTGLIVGIVLGGPAILRGEPTAGDFDKGNALMATGNFEGALQAFAKAARSERSNQEYMQRFMIVRQAVMLRDMLADEKEPERWQNVAQALHTFYLSEKVFSEALSLGEQIHAKLKSADSATQLAETQLAMDKADAAVKVLGALEPEKITPATEALHGIALARLGKLDQARKIGQRIAPFEGDSPVTLYSLARLQAAVGNRIEATGLLVRAFEGIPPSQLEGFKIHAKQSPEFAAMVTTDTFALALETASKVPESKCSSGSSCAGCPMRGDCPSGEEK